MSIIEQYMKRTLAAQHAMQTGVKLDHLRGSQDGTPKHLRVGVNTSLVQQAAVTQLLIDKGVFTEEEYWKYQAEFHEAEQRRYEEKLGIGLG